MEGVNETALLRIQFFDAGRKFPCSTVFITEAAKPFPIITSLTHNVGAIKYYGFCNINYEYSSQLGAAEKEGTVLAPPQRLPIQYENLFNTKTKHKTKHSLKYADKVLTLYHHAPLIAPPPTKQHSPATCTWCSILLYVIKILLVGGTKAILLLFYGIFISFAFIFHLLMLLDWVFALP